MTTGSSCPSDTRGARRKPARLRATERLCVKLSAEVFALLREEARRISMRRTVFVRALITRVTTGGGIRRLHPRSAGLEAPPDRKRKRRAVVVTLTELQADWLRTTAYQLGGCSYGAVVTHLLLDYCGIHPLATRDLPATRTDAARAAPGVGLFVPPWRRPRSIGQEAGVPAGKRSRTMTARTPTHVVLLVPARDTGASWNAIGSAWRNRDGSLNIALHAPAPKGARLQLRARQRSLEAMAAERAATLEQQRRSRGSAPAAPAAERTPDPDAADRPRPDRPRGGGVHAW